MKEKLLSYVKDYLFDWQVEQAWQNIGKHYPIPYDTQDIIHDLCEEFCADNDLPEGWWLNEFDNEEDVFMNL